MVSCLMGDSTALASAIVRCCPIYNRAAGGRGKYGRQKIEIRYHKPDLWFVRGPAYSCGFDLQETKITERG